MSVSRHELLMHYMCPFSELSRLVINYKGVTNVEFVEIDNANKPQILLDSNPSGEIPVLRVHKSDGTVYNVSDGLMIGRYFEAALPGPRLYPLNADGTVNELEKT